MPKKQEILEELRSVLAGRTFDALLPPLVYVIANAAFGLLIGAVIALGAALFIFLFRLFKKQDWKYALGGLLAVLLAVGLAYLTQNASSYFLPALISGGVLVLLALVSLIIGKPLAAWISHLTRAWPLDWFWRSDVKPAYREVTLFWLLILGGRFALQLMLYLKGDATTLGWANTLLGWPITIIALVLSYVYGIWRLHQLKGPGVDEFMENKLPPYRGQTRGF